MRTADAVGAAGVILLGTCTDVWAPECVRATMGSIFHTPLVKASVAEFLAWKAGQQGVLAGTHLRGAVDYRTVAEAVGKNTLFLAMGTEQSGLSDTLANACDLRVKIAMAGGAESLNLAMATGVMLYEVLRDKLPQA
jgi:TrmH family RNA methyltransferase